jgi:hypothetical protein
MCHVSKNEHYAPRLGVHFLLVWENI